MKRIASITDIERYLPNPEKERSKLDSLLSSHYPTPAKGTFEAISKKIMEGQSPNLFQRDTFLEASARAFEDIAQRREQEQLDTLYNPTTTSDVELDAVEQYVKHIQDRKEHIEQLESRMQDLKEEIEVAEYKPSLEEFVQSFYFTSVGRCVDIERAKKLLLLKGDKK